MRTLHLYRNILRHIKVFPSIKRDRLVAEVRYEFRKNRNEQNPEKLTKQIAVATKSLEQLQMYTKLQQNPGDWEVDMEKSPMPPPASAEQKKAAKK